LYKGTNERTKTDYGDAEGDAEDAVSRSRDFAVLALPRRARRATARARRLRSSAAASLSSTTKSSNASVCARRTTARSIASLESPKFLFLS